MRLHLAVGVFVLVASAGVLSTLAAGGDAATVGAWLLLALLPAGIASLGFPSGYSKRSN
jgi:hypothetical protein